MLDMGPYYITALVNLLGPVARVAGIATRARAERTITSEPLKGTKIPVEVATHVAGTLEFASRRGGLDRHELRRAEASPRADRDLRHRGEPDRAGPQPVRRQHRDRAGRAGLAERPTEHAYADGNYRIIGVADMAHAIRSGPAAPRVAASSRLHVLEVMEAFQASSDAARTSTIATRPERPAMLPTELSPAPLD